MINFIVIYHLIRLLSDNMTQLIGNRGLNYEINTLQET